MTRRWWPAATALAVVVSSCGLFGETIEPQPEEFVSPTTIPGDAEAPLVLMVGDSITQFSQPQLAGAFTARRWSNAVVGHTGTHVDENRGRIRGAVQQRPDVMVVALGTNDGLRADTPLEVNSPGERQNRIDDAVAEIEAALRDMDGVPCVVWVDINDWTDTEFLRLRTTGRALNEALRRLDAEDESLHLVGYAETFRPDDPEMTAFVAQNFDPEALHPVSEAARERFAELVAATVGLVCGIAP